MKKIIFFTVAMSMMVASSAMAVDTAKRFGLGFMDSDCPIGGRYWFSEKVGIDFGVGFYIDEEQFGTDTESATDFGILGAVPITLINTLDRVNLNLVPGVKYVNFGAFGDGDSDSLFNIFALLEAEVFVTGDFSVSAAHGVGFSSFSPGGDGAESTTDIYSVGENITNLGFHLYFAGGN